MRPVLRDCELDGRTPVSSLTPAERKYRNASAPPEPLQSSSDRCPGVITFSRSSGLSETSVLAASPLQTGVALSISVWVHMPQLSGGRQFASIPSYSADTLDLNAPATPFFVMIWMTPADASAP